jgi:hypothetical protein
MSPWKPPSFQNHPMRNKCTRLAKKARSLLVWCALSLDVGAPIRCGCPGNSFFAPLNLALLLIITEAFIHTST